MTKVKAIPARWCMTCQSWVVSEKNICPADPKHGRTVRRVR